MIVQTCRQSSAEDSIGEGGSGRPLQDTDVAESVGAEGEGGGRSTFNPDGAMRRSYEHSESTAERCQRIARLRIRVREARMRDPSEVQEYAQR